MRALRTKSGYQTRARRARRGEYTCSEGTSMNLKVNGLAAMPVICDPHVHLHVLNRRATCSLDGQTVIGTGHIYNRARPRCPSAPASLHVISIVQHTSKVHENLLKRHSKLNNKAGSSKTTNGTQKSVVDNGCIHHIYKVHADGFINSSVHCCCVSWGLVTVCPCVSSDVKIS